MTNVHKAYDDWNHLYEQEWTVASSTYSQKWGWEYSQQPSNPYPSKASLERMYGKYKKTGPRSSEMYKRLFPTPAYTGTTETESAYFYCPYIPVMRTRP